MSGVCVAVWSNAPSDYGYTCGGMSTKTHVFQANKFQPPRGTRDFYPPDMAVRRYIEKVWRAVSINHGFEEIDGPTFEHLELYTTKSGEEIVSQLFSFRREGGDTDYALRPEFTPTLARMYAARAGQLPRPTKWFCMPNFFRAERPQRGRLREFFQWNIDVLGDESPRADAEVIACAIGVLKQFGFLSKSITIKISHRSVVVDGLCEAGLSDDLLDQGMQLLDRKEKLNADEFDNRARDIGLDVNTFEQHAKLVGDMVNEAILAREGGKPWSEIECDDRAASLLDVMREVDALGLLKWCEVDFSIVRGLAYYTGTVFEIHEATGKERAIAGGGRYDGLVELFGGPPTPAVGIAMGDVVLRLMLEDHGLLPDDAALMDEIGARPDVFVISAKEELDGAAAALISRLRDEGLHVRQSYRSTRNVGKLLGDAGKCNARFAAIIDEEWAHGQVQLKNMETGEQDAVDVDELAAHLNDRIGQV